MGVCVASDETTTRGARDEKRESVEMIYFEVAFLAFVFIVMLFILWFGIDIHNLKIDIEKLKKR